MSILDKIIEQKKTEVEALKNRFWKSRNDREAYISQIQKSEISFYDALKNRFRSNRNDGNVWPKLIAEVKKGSPSQGLIRADFDVAEIVKLYDRYADAMSILTDEKFFLGSLENLKIARQNTNKPLLRKDFIIDEFQIYEARLAGADAILLLASVLNETQIQTFLNITYSLGMEALVEVHDETELQKVLKTEAKIIGINNRNLKDFSIDLNNSNKLAQLIPKDKIIVSESGINSKSEIRQIARSVTAILVGTAITKAQNMEEKLKDITGVPQVKICGITNLEDAKNAVDCGANYLGFIFYKKSPRYIPPAKCVEIVGQLQASSYKLQVKFVGVFVDEDSERIAEIVDQCGLHVVQLHGTEDSIMNYELRIKNGHLEVWRGLRIRNKKDLAQVEKFQDVEGILLDTFKKDVYGGTGESFDWAILKDFYPKQKIILAGGLDGSNVCEAVNVFHPDVLDLSSKIEKTPGKKDLKKMQEFFAEIPL